MTCVSPGYLGLKVIKPVNPGFKNTPRFCIPYICGFNSYNDVWTVDEQLKDDLAGSTANIVLVKNNKIYCVCCALFGS